MQYHRVAQKTLYISLTAYKLTLFCDMYLKLYTSQKNPILHVLWKF